MKLWNKEDNLNIKIEKFTVGNDRHYDLYLAEYDIRATIAHAKMLHNIKIITHSELAEIISELKKITGYGIILNTSFNDREPICEDASHSIRCFLGTRIDYLYFPEYSIVLSRKS